ncbi:MULTISPECIES: nucleotide pyrophosphatase/phosphodiesterase family protein [unclassified Microbacterium]|uniref:alkaline phosphatase family protein n=1 Tax=unclassified Microbacterium TaxID=2609290 RepID=UPI00214B91E6|nr:MULTISPECIES: nucleotide pyrophosphatase/phosphodiesterase family protein [unclassified Microbacterium]MCR2785622.1 alkaline phosphatase family protein [Microbacterium sp. zg.B96]WIM17393.1 alkaline phosphatase family protein [Microbacterium sp. zg-B96]
MSLSVPADPASARSLTDVMPHMVASLSGHDDWLPPAQSAIVFVVDGLGRFNLTSRAGHARFLVGAMAKRDIAHTVFPSTTAAALTSLLTGQGPGRHGIVGYRVRIPGTDEAPNQLKGWESHGLDPHSWQRAQPIFEREHGRPCFVVTKSEYAGTGFTEAILRGAEFVAADDLDERVQQAAELAARHPGALIYLYANELDALGHRHGWESDAWSAGLERVDAAARRLAQLASPRTGVVVTADHGMVDVPRHRHLLLREGDGLTDGVRVFGGEPRMLHLYADPDRAAAVHAAWLASEGDRSWVFTRDEAMQAGLFGPTDAEVIPRIGDVIVAARAGVAYYDDRGADKASQKMVGQHGSMTSEERIVPLIRLGAYAG